MRATGCLRRVGWPAGVAMGRASFAGSLQGVGRLADLGLAEGSPFFWHA